MLCTSAVQGRSWEIWLVSLIRYINNFLNKSSKILFNKTVLFLIRTSKIGLKLAVRKYSSIFWLKFSWIDLIFEWFWSLFLQSVVLILAKFDALEFSDISECGQSAYFVFICQSYDYFFISLYWDSKIFSPGLFLACFQIKI